MVAICWPNLELSPRARTASGVARGIAVALLLGRAQEIFTELIRALLSLGIEVDRTRGDGGQNTVVELPEIIQDEEYTQYGSLIQKAYKRGQEHFGHAPQIIFVLLDGRDGTNPAAPVRVFLSIFFPPAFPTPFVAPSLLHIYALLHTYLYM